MKKLKLIGLVFLVWIVWVILTATACKIAFGQSIHLTPSKLTSQSLILDISFKGQNTTLGSVSMWTYDSCTAAERFDTTGMLFITTASQAPGWFGISWFSPSITDTVWTDNRPMFTAYFTNVQQGCANFLWMTPPLENCELADIDAVVIPGVQWVDTTICLITTGIEELVRPEKEGIRYTLLGQITDSPKGYYIEHRQLHFKP